MKDVTFYDTHETAPNGGNERLQEFDFLDLLQHSQGRASNVFVGVLLSGRQLLSERAICDTHEIISDSIARESISLIQSGTAQDSPNQDHFLLELSLFVQLGADPILHISNAHAYVRFAQYSLPVKVQHLLDLLVSRGKNVLNDWHEKGCLRQRKSVFAIRGRVARCPRVQCSLGARSRSPRCSVGMPRVCS